MVQDAQTDREVESPEEAEEARHRRSPSGRVVYDAVMQEADEELERPSSALFWSALAAGLSMGFSMVGEGLLRHYLPDASWRPAVSKIGYSFGFLIVILGRQQLFTENTLTPILPLLRRKDLHTLGDVARLWGIIFAGNMLGALVFALVATKTAAFDAPVRHEFVALGHDALQHGFGAVLLKGIFAGWLIALLVWMLPYSESAHFWVILAMTWLVGIGHFSHIVAGAVEVASTAWAGEKAWATVVLHWVVPALIGNCIGGVTLVAALNHAQVVSGGGGDGDDDESGR
jgi:formate/nitrite transporter FocA (FNT family)